MLHKLSQKLLGVYEACIYYSVKRCISCTYHILLYVCAECTCVQSVHILSIAHFMNNQ
jgi:hypothetical protein